MHDRTFDSLGEFRDIFPKLASASSHNVYIDIGDSYTPANSEATDELTYGVCVDKQSIWNDRDSELAYIGSDNYTITQHADVLRTIDDALGKTVGEVGIGAVRDYGSYIDGFATLEGHSIDVAELVGEGYVPPDGAGADDGHATDTLGVGIRFQNSFDGSEKLVLETMGYRFACQNWLLWGSEEIGSQQMLHVRNLDQGRVEDLIFEVVDEKETVEETIIASTGETYPIEAVPEVLHNVGFGATYTKNITRLLQTFDIDQQNVSLWHIYNATTQHLDHDVVDGVVPETYQTWQQAATNIFMGEVGDPSPVEEFASVYSR